MKILNNLRKLSKEHIGLILEMYCDGSPIPVIANELEVRPTLIYSIITRLRYEGVEIPYRKKPSNLQVTRAIKEYVGQSRDNYEK